VSILVDTNVLSELARPRPDANVVSWVATLDQLVLSVITLEEISFGLAAKPNRRVTAWFDDFVPRHCRVLGITAPIARQAGIMRGVFAARGQVRTQADVLIAATAAQHGLSLATRNARDFQGCGIALVNPFQRAR
jgi:predicted nucleic acid-binding protein